MLRHFSLMSLIFGSTLSYATSIDFSVEGKDYTRSSVNGVEVVAKKIQSGSLQLDPFSNSQILGQCPAIKSSFSRYSTLIKACDLSTPTSTSCKSLRLSLATLTSGIPEFFHAQLAFRPTFYPEDLSANRLGSDEQNKVSSSLNVPLNDLVFAEALKADIPTSVELGQREGSITKLLTTLLPEMRPLDAVKPEFDRENNAIKVMGLDVICDLVEQKAFIETDANGKFSQSSALEAQLSNNELWALYDALKKNLPRTADEISTGIQIGLAVSKTFPRKSSQELLSLAEAAYGEFWNAGTFVNVSTESELKSLLTEKFGLKTELQITTHLTLKGN